jgi:hypothetical protein
MDHMAFVLRRETWDSTGLLRKSQGSLVMIVFIWQSVKLGVDTLQSKLPEKRGVKINM